MPTSPRCGGGKITDCAVCWVEDARIVRLAPGEASEFIHGEVGVGVLSPRELWRVFILFLLTPKVNTGQCNAQLYIRTEVVQN
jgi:hypothetical protein